MRAYVLAFAFLLLLPAGFALDEHVDVVLSANHSIEERYTLGISAAVSDNQFVFPFNRSADAILFDGNYTRTNDSLIFAVPIRPGMNKIQFTVQRSDGVVFADPYRRYGGTFSARRDTTMSVAVHLPEGNVLRNVEPAVSPRPVSIRTDGRSVVIDWVQTGPLDVIVLYEVSGGMSNASTAQPSQPPSYISSTPVSSRLLFGGVAALVALLVGAVGVALLSSRRRGKERRSARKDILMDAISPDEQVVVEFLRHGFRNQKQIAEQAGFSKSKMSKVVRKLEEKRVLTKEPHFKTNKLTLSAEWN